MRNNTNLFLENEKDDSFIQTLLIKFFLMKLFCKNAIKSFIKRENLIYYKKIENILTCYHPLIFSVSIHSKSILFQSTSPVLLEKLIMMKLKEEGYCKGQDLQQIPSECSTELC